MGGRAVAFARLLSLCARESVQKLTGLGTENILLTSQSVAN